ncbi:MAG: hypothetical protein O3B41_10880 [Bacteroidetes bacterium]|nr:hypothetical protein [Bacteroidota bacterium]
MTEGIWLSALVGAGIAGVYSLGALWLGKIAVKASQRTFMMLVMGGMVARIFVTLILLTGILLLTSLDSTALLVGFFIVFAIGLTFETIILHRRQSSILTSSEKDGQLD